LRLRGGSTGDRRLLPIESVVPLSDDSQRADAHRDMRQWRRDRPLDAEATSRAGVGAGRLLGWFDGIDSHEYGTAAAPIRRRSEVVDGETSGVVRDRVTDDGASPTTVMLRANASRRRCEH
jgi:hypothetical protein